MLPGELHIRMAHAIMSGKRICSAEGLLLGAKVTANLLLASVVDCILVARQVVGPGEDGITGLARARINPFAFVRSGLAVEKTASHPPWRTAPYRAERIRLSVALALVLL